MSGHEQFTEDLALYVAGALDAGERAQMEKHLQTCAACRRELERLRGDAALLALSVADATPPARARQRLMAAVTAEPRVPPTPRRVAPWEVWWTWAPWAAAAALALLAASIWIGNLNLRRELRTAEQRFAQQQEDLQQAENVLATLNDSDAARFTLAASSGPKLPEGKTIYARDRRSLIFLATNLPSLPPQKAYELWLIPTTGAPVPAGTFTPDANGSATVVNPSFPTDVTAKAFAVTVEPEGGSPAPTSMPVMSGSGA